MKKALIVVVGVVFVLLVGRQASAVLIGSTTIEYAAGGSPNTISGSWGTGGFTLIPGSTLEYFEVTVTELVSNFGIPESYHFDSYIPGESRSIAFGLNPVCCVAGTSIGSTVAVSSSAPFGGSWDFLLRFVDGNTPHITAGAATVAFSSGGLSADVSGEVLIEAYGKAPPAPTVPIPCAVWLFGSGLAGLVGIGRKRLKK